VEESTAWPQLPGKLKTLARLQVTEKSRKVGYQVAIIGVCGFSGPGGIESQKKKKKKNIHQRE
jgi:hypothetical protein